MKKLITLTILALASLSFTVFASNPETLYDELKPDFLAENEYVIFEDHLDFYESDDFEKTLEFREEVENRTFDYDEFVEWIEANEEIYRKFNDENRAFCFENGLTLYRYFEITKFEDANDMNFLVALRLFQDARYDCFTNELNLGPDISREDSIVEPFLMEVKLSYLFHLMVDNQLYGTQVDKSQDFMRLMTFDNVSRENILGHEFFDTREAKHNLDYSRLKNSIHVLFEGYYLYLNAVPETKDGNTMLPLTPIIEKIGGTTSWDGTTKTATFKYADREITIKIGENTATVNGEVKELPYPAYINFNRTYLPLRFISENLGLEVDWYENRIVDIKQDSQGLDDTLIDDFMSTMTEIHPSSIALSANFRYGSAEDYIEDLSNNFGVNNKEDLIEIINYYSGDGQNVMYFLEVEIAKELKDDNYLTVQLLDWDEKWGEKGIMAYDLVRAVALAEWGYRCGYITTEEAMELSLPALKKFRENFDSFEEGMENYLDGYAWFSRQDYNDPNFASSKLSFRQFTFEFEKELGTYSDDLFNIELTIQ